MLPPMAVMNIKKMASTAFWIHDWTRIQASENFTPLRVVGL
jgi:hypothetical protein